MKAFPKRKGNVAVVYCFTLGLSASMKVPPKRKGNIRELKGDVLRETASMKVPPERKGNILVRAEAATKAGPQ